MNDTQKQLFGMGMEVMDREYKAPLLYVASCRINHLAVPFSSGINPLWVGEIYDSYDPNNALFFTMAGVMVEALYADKIEPALRRRMQKAMHVACLGNRKRYPGFHGDDMGPSYSNPFYLRCACTTFTARMMGDQALEAEADSWAEDTIRLFDQYNTPGEFNSPTYAGVTLFALALAQFVPDCAFSRAAPRMAKAIWESTADVYNPTLLNVAGPWDRAYGYCMTQYYTTVGANITSLIGFENGYPLPRPLAGSEHVTDVALLPMQMITSPFIEQGVTPEIRKRFESLAQPRDCIAKSIFPPHDVDPRVYTFHIGKGLSIGGVEYSEDQLGGPKGIQAQFNPGVIQWDTGYPLEGIGCGWISVWPDDASCSIQAASDSLTVKYTQPRHFPRAPRSDKITLHIGALPFMQPTTEWFATGRESLPGLDVTLSGNVVEHGRREVHFSAATKLHGFYYIELTYRFNGLQEPTLRMQVNRNQGGESIFHV